MALESGPFSTDEFKAFAKDYVMFAHVTTRIEGRAYENLLSEKGFNGFPSLAALDEKGDIIAKLSGGRDVDGFKAMMASGAKFMEVRAKAEKTLDDEVFLLQHDIEMGNVKLADAKARAAKLEGLSDEQKKAIDVLMTNLEVQEALGSPRSREEFEEIKAKQSPVFAEMFKAGREPTSDQTYGPFFSFILDYAEQQADADLFESALNKLRAKYGDQPRNAKFFEMKDEVLEKLRSGGGDDDESGDDEDGEEGGDDDSGE